MSTANSAVCETQGDHALIEKIQADVRELGEKLMAISAQGSLLVPITEFAPEPFDLLKEIKVVVQESDGEFMASFFDANLSSQGCTPQEAFDNLKDLLLSRFDYLDTQPAERLGPAPKKQLAVLRAFMRRRAIPSQTPDSRTSASGCSP